MTPDFLKTPEQLQKWLQNGSRFPQNSRKLSNSAGTPNLKNEWLQHCAATLKQW
jgi:hypothetical protein